MCGGDANIRIEKAGNGFLVDSYEPSPKGDRPGIHKRHVAMNGDHVVRIVKKHLVSKESGRKKAARKQA